jgi:hypothetical protein
MDYKWIQLEGCDLLVLNDSRVLLYEPNFNSYKFLTHLKHGGGYYKLKINTKCYFLHRIMAYSFLNLDMKNRKLVVDHIDRNPSNNQLSNLRIVSQQQNTWNREAKGYYKRNNKFKTEIKVSNKTINLGLFDTEEEARKAYLEAKSKYHII